MAVHVNRTHIQIRPDPSRVFFRPFESSNRERIQRIVARIIALSRSDAEHEAAIMLERFEGRHEKLQGFLLSRFDSVREHLISDQPLNHCERLLIGAYFTLEYSLEAAALFNPSIVPHPDQSGTEEGSLRFLLSLRATGEGHISSIVFRTGVINKQAQILLDMPSRFVAAADVHPNPSYDKYLFERKLLELGLLSPFAQQIMINCKIISALSSSQWWPTRHFAEIASVMVTASKLWKVYCLWHGRITRSALILVMIAQSE